MTTPRKAGLRQLIRLLAPYRARWTLATAALLLGTGIKLVMPQAVRLAIDDAIKTSDSDKLATLSIVALVGFALLGLLIWVRAYLSGWLGNRVVADLRKRTFQRLLLHPPGFFQERKTGELISRLTSDIQMLHYAVGAELSVGIQSILTIVVGLVVLLAVSVPLSMAMLVTVPPLAIAAVWVGKKIRKRSREVQDEVAAANSRLKEAVVGIETVQAFQAEARESTHYGKRIMAAFDRALSVTKARAGFFAGAQFGFYGAMTVILWIGALQVLDGDLTAGALVSFLIYTAFIGGSFVGLAQIWGNLQSASGASERIFELLQEDISIQDSPDAITLENVDGEITFEDVTFAYPTRNEVDVLNEVSFTAQAGETVALVGHSGAGKSTLVSLLFRFFEPQQGRITLDGQNLKDLSLTSLRASMAIVSQEPVLFSGSIADNIAYGVDACDDDRLLAAAEAANVTEFIPRLPKGLDTLVGERGVKLSSGQRQRIAIARALLSNPKILILDEATSHLDSANEALVQEALDRLKAGRTTLVIAHRLSTVHAADRILVLDRGKVVESGDHQSLIALKGVYHDLTAKQLVVA
jgi:ABC transporter fused permease/ATP-binding protein